MTTQGRIAPFDDASYDPFEVVERSVGASKVANPYPDFAELRREGAVHKRDLAELYELENIEGLDLPDAYTVLTHEGVEKVLRDGQTFSSSGYAESMGMVMGHSILEMDEPEHRAYRGLIQQAFTRKAMVRWESELVRPIVDRFIDSFAGRGRADLVSELTFPFPVQVIAGMLGLPEEDLDTFHAWAVGLISVGADFVHGMVASGKMRGYFAAAIALIGHNLPAVSIINDNLGAANHYPARYPDPERFDIFRDPRPHMAFASGPHMCLGMHLARMETTVAVGSLLDRLPGLRLDPDAPPPEIRGLAFRAPKELRVVFD